MFGIRIPIPQSLQHLCFLFSLIENCCLKCWCWMLDFSSCAIYLLVINIMKIIFEIRLKSWKFYFLYVGPNEIVCANFCKAYGIFAEKWFSFPKANKERHNLRHEKGETVLNAKKLRLKYHQHLFRVHCTNTTRETELKLDEYLNCSFLQKKFLKSVVL